VTENPVDCLVCERPTTGVVSVLTGKDAMQIVRAVDAHGTVRFGDPEEHLPAASTATLSDRLAELWAAGLLSRTRRCRSRPRWVVPAENTTYTNPRRVGTGVTRLRIALLQASRNPDTPRNFRREIDAELVEFDVPEGRLPETFDFDAAVITGSRASVYWDEPWIAPLKAWVREAAERELPLLGICYGHQLLAAALGGTVEAMDEYEIGYREVTHDGSALLEGIESPMTVFTTHSDAVTELPPDAAAFASNEYGNHGFRVGNAFGVQFHPEYDARMAEAVTRAKDLPEERIEGVLDGITEENSAAAREAKALFTNFTAFVRERRKTEAATTG
jgi:GMP synthase (glutamine-hydrolysing)